MIRFLICTLMVFVTVTQTQAKKVKDIATLTEAQTADVAIIKTLANPDYSDSVVTFLTNALLGKKTHFKTESEAKAYVIELTDTKPEAREALSRICLSIAGNKKNKRNIRSFAFARLSTLSQHDGELKTAFAALLNKILESDDDPAKSVAERSLKCLK